MGKIPSLFSLFAFTLMIGLYAPSLHAQASAEKVDSLTDALKSAKSDSHRVKLYLELLESTRFSPSDETFELVEEALLVAEEYGDPNSLGMIWFWKGWAHNQTGDFPGFIESNEQATEYFAQSESTKMEISCQINIGSALMQMGKAREGNEILAKALEQAKSKDDPQLLAIAQNNIAISYASHGDFDQAEVFFLQALQTQLQVGDSLEASNAAGNLGTLNFRTGKYLKAIKFFVYTAEIDEHLGNLSGKGTSYHNISLVYTEMGDFTSAIEYGEQSLDLFKEINNLNGMVMSLAGLGDLKTEMQDLDAAYEFYSQAIDTCRRYDLKNEIYGQSLKGAGHYWKEKGDIPAALIYLNEAKSVFQTAGVPANLPALNLLLAQIYQSQNRFQLAEQTFTSALEASTTYGDLNTEMAAHKGLAELYEAWQKPSQALREHKLAASVEDSIFTVENRKGIAEIQARYDTERRKRLLSEEKQRSETLKFEKELVERKNLLLIQIALFISLLLVVLIVAVWIYNRQKRRIVEQEKALTIEQLKWEKIQTAHLESITARQASEIGTRTRLFSEIKLELEGMKEKYAAAKPIEFMHLFKVVELNVRSDGEWEAFKQNFERLHPSFFEHLQTQHSNLSPAEQRLCVLVRLGMSKKDIANILNINPDSVKRARNRLRHKLEIGPTVELKDYLHSL